MKLAKVFCLLAVLLCTSFPLVIADSPPSLSDEQVKRMEWWREAKFGMFIHWGVYSLAGGEWNGETNHAEWLQLTAKIPLDEYTDFARTFNPAQFDADQWVKIAKDAGMKYLVITSKHHDGLAMYDSAANSHNVLNVTEFKRDPIKELSEACKKQGIRFCVYYSLGRDWEDPDVPTGYGSKKGWRSNLIDFPNEDEKDFQKYFDRKVKPQVRELLTNYGQIGVMWFDTFEHISKQQSEELIALIRELQPDCIINDRVGRDLGDYKTSEQEIPSGALSQPWESCMTMNGHWSFNKADDGWRTSENLVHNLIDIVSKGGNYLLNVGPTGEGVIPEPSVIRLSAMGDWLETNGEAIYDCGPTPFGAEVGDYSEVEKDKNGKPKFVSTWKWRATTKPGKIYVHVLDRSVAKMELPIAADSIKKCYKVSDPSHATIQYNESSSGISVSFPDALATKRNESLPIVLCFEIRPQLYR